jgi:large subunit ribosomal protein L24
MEKIRKGDDVIVVTGRDKGKRGTVLKRVDEAHVLVEGINVVKKHTKPNPMKGQTGGITDKTMPLNISNVALFNPATQKADRVGFKILDDARKVRIFKSSGAQVDAK